jgi:cytochrome bd ubiquinol oxidase subunit II
MPVLWFCIVMALLATYVVLDGVDLGAAAIFPIAAKTQDERRRAACAIGSVFDGNELWLIAAGVTVYFVFPQAYAATWRGFRTLVIMVLCLFVLRAIGIGISSRVEEAGPRKIFELGFIFSSVLLAFVLGVALGNVVRGVPLDASGYFVEPPWTDFKLDSDIGLFDWYTVLIGVMALFTVIAHGAYYIALKTDGDLGRRARGFALICWPVQFFLTFTALVATYFIRPEIIRNYSFHKIGLVVPVAVVTSLAIMLWATPRGKEKLAFMASSAYIVSMVVGTAFAIYPVLISAREHRYDLTIFNSFSSAHNFGIGFTWLTMAAVCVVACFVYFRRTLRGKIPAVSGNS